VKVLITGGTGFVGQALAAKLALDGTTDQFHFVGRRRTFLLPSLGSLDVRPWDVTKSSELAPVYDAVIHAATPASAEFNTARPMEMIDIIYQGMRNVLDFVLKHEQPPRLIFVSSGGVYGEMPESEDRFDENSTNAVSPMRPDAAYAEAKRLSEVMTSIAATSFRITGIVTRLFAFAGPHLPRDRHFAIGNFVRDAVVKQRITVRSDGSAVRSYLDEKDMAEWLLAILNHGEPGFPYHVGSERPISIRDLAFLVARRYEAIAGAGCEVEILGQRSPLDGVSRYVPSTKKTRERLSVEETVSLEESIDSMIRDAIATEATAH